MTCTNGRINDVYRKLCRIMRHPQEFGLGGSVPDPLANALEGVLSTLSQIQLEQVFNEKGDLAAELSQDADTPSSECSADNGGSTALKVTEFCAR
jgi:hypothetical protein